MLGDGTDSTVTSYSNSTRVLMRPDLGSSSGDVLLDGITTHTQQSWGFKMTDFASRLWCRYCTGRDNEGHIWYAGGGYNSNAREHIFERCWIWANGHRHDGTSQGNNSYSDYGCECHAQRRLVWYKCFFEGGMNHSISLKHHSGYVDGTDIYECIFGHFTEVPFGATNTTGQTTNNVTAMDLGQNADNYLGNGVGDGTCGYVRVKRCTFMDCVRQASWDPLGHYHNIGMHLKNILGATIEENEFWPGVERPFDTQLGDFAAGRPTGTNRAWSSGFLIRNNTFRASRNVLITRTQGSASGDDSAGYATNPTMTFTTNNTPGGLCGIDNRTTGFNFVRTNGDASGFGAPF